MNDRRKPFDDAVASFRAFAAAEERPSDLLWISQDRIRVLGGRAWIFRPDELLDGLHARRFYEAARTRDSSIKFLGFGECGGRYYSTIEEMRAPLHRPKQFYMSLWGRRDFRIVTVQSRAFWKLLRLLPSLLSRDERLIEMLELARGIPKA